MSLATVLKACNFVKKRLQQKIIKKKTKLVERLPLLELNCFMNKYNSLQAGQLPTEHLPFLQNLLNFIITNYLKQEVDDNLHICMDEHSPCGFSTGDIKIYQCQVIKR